MHVSGETHNRECLEIYHRRRIYANVSPTSFHMKTAAGSSRMISSEKKEVSAKSDDQLLL